MTAHQLRRALPETGSARWIFSQLFRRQRANQYKGPVKSLSAPYPERGSRIPCWSVLAAGDRARTSRRPSPNDPGIGGWSFCRQRRVGCRTWQVARQQYRAPVKSGAREHDLVSDLLPTRTTIVRSTRSSRPPRANDSPTPDVQPDGSLMTPPGVPPRSPRPTGRRGRWT